METKQPGTGPAIKRKQYSQSHCANVPDEDISASSCQETPKVKTIRNVVKQVPIDKIIIDVSVIEAIRRWRFSGAIANTVAYNYEVEDKNLLGLERMERMMAEDKNIRPPLRLERVGGAYCVLDGRHRLARSHLLGIEKIDAIVMNTGHSDFVLAGGEENPGPEASDVLTTEPLTSQAGF